MKRKFTVRRTIFLLVALGLLVAAAVGGGTAIANNGGKGGPDKVRQAEGNTLYTLNFTCDPTFSGGPPCEFVGTTGPPECNAGQPGGQALDPCILRITGVNAQTWSGTYKGTGVFAFNFDLNLITNEFTSTGTQIFNGRVKAAVVGRSSSTPLLQASLSTTITTRPPPTSRTSK